MNSNDNERSEECVWCSNLAEDGSKECYECRAFQDGRPCVLNDWLIGCQWLKPDDKVVGEFRFTECDMPNSEPARKSQVDAIRAFETRTGSKVFGQKRANNREVVGNLRLIM